MTQEPDESRIEPQTAEAAGENSEVALPAPIATTGMGSYIAVTCSVMMALVTLILVVGLLIARWLT
jgi:hypothetical protein